jgi:hypothetical protein
VSGTDRAIRVSTAFAVLGVAGIAAYVSYQHALEVVRAHGESGITARLEPATIDGLVYSSSMVVLYAARHRLPVPALARWLLALGIVATLAANVAHGWSHGPAGAAVAAWPAASLVGSYELLLWLIRTAAAGSLVREPVEDQQERPGYEAEPSGLNGYSMNHPLAADRTSVLLGPGLGHTYQLPRHGPANGPVTTEGDSAHNKDVEAAAVAAYQDSVASGSPLSERRLAAMFGKTSRRWARNRIGEAHKSMQPVTADGR